MRKLVIVLFLASLAPAQSLKLDSGVKINPGVRLQRAVNSLQTPALAQPIAMGSTSATFSAANTAHNLIVVIVGWNDTTRSITGVTDSAGNTYAAAAAQASGSLLRQAIYYAKDIAAYAAGNVVTPAWDGTPSVPQVEILEFYGLDRTSPLAASSSKSGTYICSACNRTVVATDAITSVNAELLVAGGISSGSFAAPGSLFNASSAGTALAEFREVPAGSHAADAVLSALAQNWLLSAATFKLAEQTVFSPSPVLTGIAPGTGDAAGGTTVTITGTGFLPQARVVIGGMAATNTALVSPATMTASTPAHFSGAADVTVANPGKPPITLAGAFTYTGGSLLTGFGAGGLGENGYGD